MASTKFSVSIVLLEKKLEHFTLNVVDRVVCYFEPSLNRQFVAIKSDFFGCME